MNNITKQELATILAALRFYQDQELASTPENRPDHIHDIATDNDTLISLDSAGIDALCEKLNLPEKPKPTTLRDAANRVRDLYTTDYLRPHADGGRVKHAFIQLSAALDAEI